MLVVTSFQSKSSDRGQINKFANKIVYFSAYFKTKIEDATKTNGLNEYSLRFRQKEPFS